jgi:hypothetical protein
LLLELAVKRTELKRKTPLKAKKGFNTPSSSDGYSSLKTHKPMKQVSDKRAAKLAKEGKSIYSTLSSNTELKSNSTIKTKTPLQAKTQIKSLSELKSKGTIQSGSQLKAASAPKKRKNSMQGHGRTKTDVAFHSRIVKLGCAACAQELIASPHPLQVHHPEGRSRGAEGDYKERYAICLCSEHHDQRIYGGFHNGLTWVAADRDIPSVHHAKKSFYDRYGSEHFLVHEQYIALEECPPWLDASEWGEYLTMDDKEEKEIWLARAMDPNNANRRRQIAAAS